MSQLHHGMAAGHDFNLISLGQDRTDIVVEQGHLGQGSVDIQVSQGPGSAQQTLGEGPHLLAHLAEDGGLQVQDALLGIKNERLVFLEFRGDKPLGVDQRLLADVFLGHGVQVGFGDFNVIAKDLVVAHLEGFDARAFPLSGLQIGHPTLGIARGCDHVVQLGREPRANDSTAGQGSRGIFGNGLLDQSRHLRTGVEGIRDMGQGVLVPHPLHHFPQPGHHFQALTYPQQVSRPGDALYRAVGQTFQVSQFFEQGPDLSSRRRVVVEGIHGIQAPLQLMTVEQRLVEPLTKQPPSHSGHSGIQHPQQRALDRSGADGLE